MTEALYFTSAPTFKVDGSPQGALARDLLRLEVEETTEGLKTLQARFIAVGRRNGQAEELLYLDGAILDFGKEIEVAIGPPSGQQVIFKGLISGLQASFDEGEPPEVSVFAEDALMKLRMTRRLKTYEQVSDADIASQVAAEHGLSPSTAADGPTYDVVHQLNMSDLAFLRDRARLIQAEIWVDGRTLNFKTRPNRNATAVTLVQDNHLISVRLRADLAHQRSKVKVSGYDAEAREAIDEESGADAIQPEVASGTTGVAVLQRALGERVSHRVREAPLQSAEALAWAKGEMLRRSRAFVTVVGTTRGTPELVVGSDLTLERVGEPFVGGGYYTTRVQHTYDLTSGHRTHFEAERPTVNR